MGLISDKYREARASFQECTIAQAMAKGLAGVPVSEIAHENGTPRFEFMQAANAEYRSRGGSVEGHGLGDLAHALLAILSS